MGRKKGPISRTRTIKRGISDENFYKFINSLKAIKYKVYFRVLRYEGLRCEEGLRLNIYDIPGVNYYSDGNIVFKKQKNGNDGESWTTREKTKRLLNKYISIFRDKIEKNNGYLFFSNWGGHIRINTIESVMYNYRKKIGLNKEIYGKYVNGRNKYVFSIHSLKHEHHREVLKRMAKRWQRIDTISALLLTRHRSLGGLMPYINEVREVKKALICELFGEHEGALPPSCMG